MLNLVLGLVAEASSQLESLSTRMILGPGTGKTIQPEWMVLNRDLEDKWSLWSIYLEYYGVFSR